MFKKLWIISNNYQYDLAKEPHLRTHKTGFVESINFIGVMFYLFISSTDT